MKAAACSKKKEAFLSCCYLEGGGGEGGKSGPANETYHSGFAQLFNIFRQNDVKVREIGPIPGQMLTSQFVMMSLYQMTSA